MVSSNFKKSLAFTRREEGGNDDDPHDHGGRTSRGITQAEWDRYRIKHPELPHDVWEAPDSAIDDVYKTQYWSPYADKLPLGLDLCYFDYAVNAGQRQASMCLQRALGVEADGHIGLEVMDALESADVDAVIQKYIERRRNFYKQLKQFKRYGAGWIARTNRCERTALKMAGGGSTMPLTLISQSPKANPDEAKDPLMSPETAGTATGGGGFATGTLQQIKDFATDHADTIKWALYISLAITVAMGLYTLYSYWQSKRVAKYIM